MSTGVRIALERAASEVAPWTYRGSITAGEREIQVSASLADDGSVAVAVTDGKGDGAGEDPPDLATAALVEKVRLLIRTIGRQARTDGLDPPRRILRWRESRD